MVSKKKKAALMQKKAMKRKQSLKKNSNDDPYARRCVTKYASLDSANLKFHESAGRRNCHNDCFSTGS
jgi:hypothetical protein